jgi:phosphoglycolate phosphatase
MSVPDLHVVFDWNGTILNDVALAAECVSGVLGARGLGPVDVATYRRHFDFPVRSLYEKLGLELDDSLFDRLMTDYLSVFDARAPQCALHDGAIELFEQLRRSDVGMSILSATYAPTLCGIVSAFGLDAYFAHVAGLESRHAAGKDGLARDLAKRLSTEAASVWYVGDTRHDLEIAQALGWRPFLVAFGHQDLHTLDAGAFTLIERLGDLLLFLDPDTLRGPT